MVLLRKVVEKAYYDAIDELLPYYPECLNISKCTQKVADLNTKADKLFDLLNEISFAILALNRPAIQNPNDPYPF